MKPYDNKKHYDSGRLRHKINFLGDVVTDDGYGDSIVTGGFILSTWAGKDEVSTYTATGLNAGQTQYDRFQYFVIRNRKNFMPKKDMTLAYNGFLYIIREVRELDDPCTFLKLLCIASEQPIDVNTGVIYAGGTTTIPTTEAQIKALPNVFTESSTQFTFSTGLNRIFTVALPQGKTIKVYDLTSEENVTDLYIPSAIEVDSQNYTAFTQVNTLPFTTNHIHQVTIS